MTKALFTEKSWVGAVLPLFIPAVDVLQETNVTSDACRLKTAFLEAISGRIKILLSPDRRLPISGRARFSDVIPTGYAMFAYLNSRFSAAIEASIATNNEY